MQERQAIESSGVGPDHITKIAHAFRSAKTVLSAVELGVFTVLAEGSLDRDTLGERLGIDKRGVRDFLDSLVALGLLARDSQDRYANMPETDLYLDRCKSTYIGGELEHFNFYVYPHWNLLTTALRTGKPQSGERAAGHYAALYTDPSAAANFAKGMTGGSLAVGNSLAAVFPWQEYRTFVDIGTAQGCLPVLVARAHPQISGGGFDLPPLKPVFDDYVRQHDLSARLRFFPGDFLKDQFPAADVLVLGRILHNWDLTTKRMLLKKAHEALSAGGALIVYERLIDDERRVNAAALLASLNMLIMTAGGFDFTGADCIEWMRETGFRDTRLAPLTREFSMVIGVK